jgi:hypothetical protein
MNRETRDKLVSGTNQSDLTSGNACWETPPAVYAALHAEYGFDIDLTADPVRRLCPTWFGPHSPFGTDALTAHWTTHGKRGYSNPPYGPFVQKLLAKAKQEAAKGFFSVLLLPMRATKAFHAHVLDGASNLLFCDKRLTFFENGVPRLNAEQWKKGKLQADPAVFDSIIVVHQPFFGMSTTVRAGAWKVPPHVTKDDLERAAQRLRERVA